MTTYDQQANSYNTSSITLPQPVVVAIGSGSLLALLLLLAALPLLVSAGLWLLGLALTLVGYAFISNRNAQTAVWDQAIIAQGLGLLGIGLLFGASLLG